MSLVQRLTGWLANFGDLLDEMAGMGDYLLGCAVMATLGLLFGADGFPVILACSLGLLVWGWVRE